MIIADCVEANDLCGIYNNYNAKNPCRVCSVTDGSFRKRNARDVCAISLSAARMIFANAISQHDSDSLVIADADDADGAVEEEGDDDDSHVEQADESSDGGREDADDDDDDDDYLDSAPKRKRKPAIEPIRTLRASTSSSSSSSSSLDPESIASAISINPGILVRFLMMIPMIVFTAVS